MGSRLNNAFGNELKTPAVKQKVRSEIFSKPSKEKATTLAIETKGRDESVNSKGKKSSPHCPKCNAPHGIWKCTKFKTGSYLQRLKDVRTFKLCMSCLSNGHFMRDCTMGFSCRTQGCGSRHHTLMHPPSQSPSEVTTGSQTNVTSLNEVSETQSEDKATVGVLQASRPRVCFKIVPVRVRSRQGAEITTYAFLDSGSDSTLCSNSLIERLNLTGPPMNVEMETANGIKMMSSCKVQFEVSALNEDNWFWFDRVLTTDVIPVHKEHFATAKDLEAWPHLSDITLSEIGDEEVLILIGNDHPEIVEAQLDVRQGQTGFPVAVKTPLGWTVCGPVKGAPESGEYCINRVSVREDLEISAQLQKLYNTEFGGTLSEEEHCSVEDVKAREHMTQTACLVNGHYQIGLPLRNRSYKLPNSLPVAQKRLHLLKKRFEKNPEFKEQYCKVITRYLSEGAAVRVSLSEHNQLNPRWFLPHHAVWHPRKPKEPRVVFDCAARSGGISLNDLLLKGPDNTSTLLGVLLRFRLEAIGVAADIKSMFHQVFVSPDDRGALSFLWWPEGDLTKEPSTYTMKTHIFGAKSSPSVCSFALRKTAQDHTSEFSTTTIDAVFNSFYVDDLLRSFSTEEEAIQTITELRNLLSKGGFNLTKFTSSSRPVLETVPQEDRAAAVKDLNLNQDTLPCEKALGVHWNVEEDTFALVVGNKDVPNTRRGILSSIATVYDPLGFASPLLLPGRLINQDLCRSKFGWDDNLPQHTIDLFARWREGLSTLEGFGFSRHFKPKNFDNVERIELHHFADASEQFGYGTVSYLRFVNVEGEACCSFLYGKSRVKPLRAGITVPKLELTAATVLVSVHQMLMRELASYIEISRVFFWTDSIIVLKYIHNEEKRFIPFVANRVAKIKEGSDISQWKHVRSAENPADLASRGIKPEEESKLEMWINGPSFLTLQEGEWPPQPEELSEKLRDDEEGVRKESGRVNVLVTNEDEFWSSLFNRFSSWSRLRRVVAWTNRAVDKWRCKTSRDRIPESREQSMGFLTVEELKKAEEQIVRAVQKQSFDGVVHASTGEIKGNLLKLKPFYQDGILRVGGRLSRSLLPFDFQHPMILPSHHVVTKLLILHYHERSGHSGSQHVLAALRHRFWVVSGVSSVRSVIRKCHVCRRERAKVGEQLMSPLPSVRVTSDSHRLIYPFSSVGIDMFGTLQTRKDRATRSSKEPTNKRYGCIFTCLRYRAVHLELVRDLSTESFINAFLRFVSRRGSPLIVYSDNGTNFHGAEKDVLQAMRAWDQERISKTLAERSISWNFNPPAASHQGGVWERIIRSIRKILHSMIRDQLVDDETLVTLLCEVEKILNDRPITRASDDPQDEEVLTPSHILLLRNNPSMPPRLFPEEEKFRARWKHVNILADRFWQRWLTEYLPTLQERQRWLKKKANFAIGDLVLIVDKSLPRGKWMKGVIQETYPDSEGLVRRVVVRTANGLLNRDIRKLCMLEENLVKIYESEFEERRKKKEE